MEQKEMIVLLSSGNYMTYLDRVEIAVHMKALSERLHQQEAEIEKLVQERGTMRASSPTMEWISVEDEPIPGEESYIFTVLPEIIIKRNPVTGEPAYWMRLEPPQPKVPTFKDVFLEKFPKAGVDEEGVPKSCLMLLYGNDQECPYDNCSECWNQPYFETEEEGEANA